MIEQSLFLKLLYTDELYFKKCFYQFQKWQNALSGRGLGKAAPSKHNPKPQVILLEKNV